MKKIIMPLLFLSVAFVAQASANEFSNPKEGIDLNIGSAPNPTPEEIRANGMPVLGGETAATPNTAVATPKQDTRKTTAGDREHKPMPGSGATVAAQPASQSR